MTESKVALMGPAAHRASGAAASSGEVSSGKNTSGAREMPSSRWSTLADGVSSE